MSEKIRTFVNRKIKIQFALLIKTPDRWAKRQQNMQAKEVATATRHLTLALTAREHGLSHVIIDSGDYRIETTIFAHNAVELSTARQLVIDFKMKSDEIVYTNLSEPGKELHTWELRTEWIINE